MIHSVTMWVTFVKIRNFMDEFNHTVKQSVVFDPLNYLSVIEWAYSSLFSLVDAPRNYVRQYLGAK